MLACSTLLSDEVPDRDRILAHLKRVLDPELDESILELGFVRTVEVLDGEAVVEIQLPTSWCAANFAYMMAEDIRRELLSIESIRKVTIRLGDHFAASTIEKSINAGQPFDDAFACEGGGSLKALRRTFREKAFTRRQEQLLRKLIEAGKAPTDICELHVADLHFHDGSCCLHRVDGDVLVLGPAELGEVYLSRRIELGFPCSSADWLIVDLNGEAIPASRLAAYVQMARTVRVSLEANGALCRALLAARDQCWELSTVYHKS